MIRAYSDGQDSPVENSKLRAENEYLRKELELSKLKTDQLKHESCQEQRLITNNWYQNVIILNFFFFVLKLIFRHYLILVSE